MGHVAGVYKCADLYRMSVLCQCTVYNAYEVIRGDRDKLKCHFTIFTITIPSYTININVA